MIARPTAAEIEAKSAKARAAHRKPAEFADKFSHLAIGEDGFTVGWPKKAKKAKYRSVPTKIDGIRFASKKEAARYAALKLLEKAGQITDLKLQPVIKCQANGVHICDYRADFFYVQPKVTPLVVYEDCKGFKTPVYRLKRKLVKALTGIEIVET
jgi:hypothetical protein